MPPPNKRLKLSAPALNASGARPEKRCSRISVVIIPAWRRSLSAIRQAPNRLTDPDPPSPPPPAATRRPRRWGLPLFCLVTLVVCSIVFFMNEPGSPNDHWKLPTGDTIEILTFENWYEGSVNLITTRPEGAHYLWVQFRSDFTDPDGDRRRATGVAHVLCRAADSMGIARLKVEPTRKRFFGLVRYSRPYWFDVKDGECPQVVRH